MITKIDPAQSTASPSSCGNSQTSQGAGFADELSAVMQNPKGSDPAPLAKIEDGQKDESGGCQSNQQAQSGLLK